MAATLRLTVVTGPHRDKRFCFRNQTECKLGRAHDCFVQLVGDERDQRISRHHCQFHIDLPCVQLTDLGSRNGTFVNAEKVNTFELDILDAVGKGVRLEHGDLITVGGTSPLVEFVDCPPPETALTSVWPEGVNAIKDCAVKC